MKNLVPDNHAAIFIEKNTPLASQRTTFIRADSLRAEPVRDRFNSIGEEVHGT